MVAESPRWVEDGVTRVARTGAPDRQVDLEHRRATVRAGARQGGALQLRDQGAHLLQRQHLIGADRAVAGGDARPAVRVQLSALPPLRGLFEDSDDRLAEVAHAAAVASAAGIARTAQARAPNGSNAKPSAARSVAPISTASICGGVRSRTSGSSRSWLSGAARSAPARSLVEQDPLVRGVLVDQEDPLRSLRDDVRRADLAEDAQRWEATGWRLRRRPARLCAAARGTRDRRRARQGGRGQALALRARRRSRRASAAVSDIAGRSDAAVERPGRACSASAAAGRYRGDPGSAVRRRRRRRG